jgi:hypothetical protein
MANRRPGAAAALLPLLLGLAGTASDAGPAAGPTDGSGPSRAGAAGRGAPGLAGGSVGDPTEGVGRWERGVGRCRLKRQPATGAVGSAPVELRCRRLRLDQQMRGLLSVRFLAADGAASQLVFAGMLAPGSRPMDCRQLRCFPRWPLGVNVRAVARSALLTERGGGGLLQAQLAQGRCDLDRRRLQCWVRAADGEEWRAEVQGYGR